jgi:hypothetical protein
MRLSSGLNAAPNTASSWPLRGSPIGLPVATPPIRALPVLQASDNGTRCDTHHCAQIPYRTKRPVTSSDIAFGFLLRVVLGVAGAELTAGLSRLAGKHSPRGQVAATPTDILLATFCRLFSILRSQATRDAQVTAGLSSRRHFGVHPGNPGVDANHKAHDLEGHMGV